MGNEKKNQNFEKNVFLKSHYIPAIVREPKKNIGLWSGQKPKRSVRNRGLQRLPRSLNCLFRPAGHTLGVKKINPNSIRYYLGFSCKSIEHQIVALRRKTQLTHEEYLQRYEFTQRFLKCLQRHHGIMYEGILFGSTINGLGLHDSDVDLRLRPLYEIDDGKYEPMTIDENSTDKILNDIAYHTTRCSPSVGIYVPSSRCPVAKLNFLLDTDRKTAQEGLKYDVSVSSSNSLGSFNSLVLRFFCQLEPKFHLMATVLRYWTNVHELVLPGLLSSYAVINMLIYFCQTIQPPLLPTVNQMRDIYFEHESQDTDQKETAKKAILQQEWNCIVCLKKKFYKPSSNNKPLSVLLLKFFELYLTFPYSTHIITTRPGKALSKEEFKSSGQFHPRFPVKNYLNIQDPFDFKHNLTSGMDGAHFRILLLTIRISYEKLFSELTANFWSPLTYQKSSDGLYKRKVRAVEKDRSENGNVGRDFRDWGINSLFVKLTEKELKEG